MSTTQVDDAQVTEIIEAEQSEPQSAPPESAPIESPAAITPADNIADGPIAEPVAKPTPTGPPAPVHYNVSKAGAAIAKHYERSFRNLIFKPPLQIIDGSSVEFLDGDINIVVAGARLRFLNFAQIDATGDMVIHVALSDLTFERPAMSMSVPYRSQ